MKSIMQENPEVCPVCFDKIMPGEGVCHHVFNGTANRKKSDEDGMTLIVHQTMYKRCHDEIHAKQGLDLSFKAKGQKVWCEYYDKTENEFMERYGKNYREAFYEWQRNH